MVLKLSKWQKICLKKKYKRPTDWNLSNKMRKCQKSKKEYRWKEKCIQKMWGTNKKKNVEFKKLEKTKITEESEKVDWRIKEKEIQVKKERKSNLKSVQVFQKKMWNFEGNSLIWQNFLCRNMLIWNQLSAHINTQQPWLKIISLEIQSIIH